MHVSIAATLIIILFVVAAHAAGSLTVQETEVSETGSGQELRQLPCLDPGRRGGGGGGGGGRRGGRRSFHMFSSHYFKNEWNVGQRSNSEFFNKMLCGQTN